MKLHQFKVISRAEDIRDENSPSGPAALFESLITELKQRGISLDKHTKEGNEAAAGKVAMQLRIRIWRCNTTGNMVSHESGR